MYRGWKNSVYHLDVILPLWQCESKYQHQNYAENRWQTVKRYTNRVMDRSGCPPYIWFLALSYVIFCLNHCVDPNLADGTKSPLQVAIFLMTDIIPLCYISTSGNLCIFLWTNLSNIFQVNLRNSVVDG
jgi:hypothetical protein